ncbi:MAG: S1C family serine protease [Phycisphaerae bacterium]|jgi:serine protease Do|nr:trypsin-like peptidase domain-containing protein [Phycisphaerae bacterium]MCZ2400565.1 S1C family serine protease [Phycisphaerae bacterium]
MSPTGRLRRWMIGAAGAAALLTAAPHASASPLAAPDAALRDAQARVFRAALEAVSPLVVRIETVGGAPPLRQDASGEIVTAPGFVQADGPTTGVIWTSEGHVLTSSFNFAREPAVIVVRLQDGRRFVARLLARDTVSRLALLKINADGLPTPTCAPPDRLVPGRWALAAGMGHGSSVPTVSIGIISAVRRANGTAVQTDAKLSPANYGGPLFDIEGRVLGICVPISDNDGDELAAAEWYDSGVGFAIDCEHIARRLPRLMAGESLERGMLGVALIDGERVVGSETAEPGGVTVVGDPIGPAAAVGLRAGDVIVAIDGEATPRLLEFRRAMARRAAGDEIELSIRREAGTSRVRLRLARAAELRHPAMPPEQAATRPASGG